MKVFKNNTTLNNKTQIFTKLELKFKKYGSSGILMYEGEVYNNLNYYWITESELKKLNELVELISISVQ